MTLPVPTAIPSALHAGSTVTWTRTVASDYSNDSGYDLRYDLVNAEGQIQIASTTQSGVTFTFAITQAVSQTWASGVYGWHLWAVKSGEQHLVDAGTLEIRPDVGAASSGLDTRSHVKKTLDALETLIQGRALTDADSYSIAGRSLSKMSIESLLSWRDKYKAFYRQELDAEKVARGLDGSNVIRVRFSGR